MDPKLQASFIPKKPLSDMPTGHARRSGGSVNLFFLVSLIIFLIFLAASAGVFFLNKHQQAVIKQKDGLLLNAQKDLSADLIKTLTRLDLRIETAKGILNRHLAISAIFRFLENYTSKSVRFQSLSYSVSQNNIPMITLRGEGKSFNAVAFQSDVFRDVDSPLKNPLFSEIQLEDKGTVTFNVNTSFDPAFLLYKNNLNTASSTNR